MLRAHSWRFTVDAIGSRVKSGGRRCLLASLAGATMIIPRNRTPIRWLSHLDDFSVQKPFLRAVTDNYARVAPVLIVLALFVTLPRTGDADLESFLRGTVRAGLGLGILLIFLAPGTVLYTALSTRSPTRLGRDLASAFAGATTLVAAVMIPISLSPNAGSLISDPGMWATIAGLGAVCAFAGRRVRNDWPMLLSELRRDN